MIYLKQIRLDKGVSQQAVADYLGITRQAYSNYENENREPDKETLLKLAEYFETTVDILLRGYDQARKPTEREIKAAFFEGADTSLSETEMDELWEDAKEYFYFKIKQRKKKRD